jgi:hypothetical protein
VPSSIGTPTCPRSTTDPSTRSRQGGVDLAAAAVDDDEAATLGGAREHTRQRLPPIRLLEQLAAELDQRVGLHSRPVRSS